MHKLLKGRHHPQNVNKPLPEPLVDPDEGKTPIGELVIVPIQGRDLPNRERFGKQDAFILFKLGNVSKRSSTDVRGGQRPRWKDDQITILMYESDAKDAKSLYVSCLDEDHQKNDLIADCVINLDRVLEQGELDDWFELTYKGREAGELMLQLTYYSHDPKHPTSKMNRPYKPPGPSNGAPLRRPIRPANSPADRPVSTSPASSAPTDNLPIYKPPVVTEPASSTPPTAVTGGYPHDNNGRISPMGGMAPPVGGRVSPLGGRISPFDGRVSPSGQNQYAGQQAPNAANPYPPMNTYSGYPNSQMPYPPVGYPSGNAGGYPPQHHPQNNGGGYPPQFNTVNGYPPQHNNNQFNSGYPPQNYNNTINGYPPQPPFNNNGYPPMNNGGGLYPPAQQPLNRPASPAGGGGYPPAGYPYGASNLYPPNAGGGYPPQQQQQQQQQQHHQQQQQPQYQQQQQQQQPQQQQPQQQQPQQQQQQSRPVPAPPSSKESGLNTFPGAFPGSNPYSPPSTTGNSNYNTLGGHKQSFNSGQPASSNIPRSSSPMVPGEYPQSRSPSPPMLPPRNNNNSNNAHNHYHSHAPQAIVQPAYGAGRY
ncbi:hypothetical protein BGX27_003281 [Mortierella sp. AM989]|nr:hypothetical protein BGX27_003281 [Mortierella sp. AM989]